VTLETLQQGAARWQQAVMASQHQVQLQWHTFKKKQQSTSSDCGNSSGIGKIMAQLAGTVMTAEYKQ